MADVVLLEIQGERLKPYEIERFLKELRTRIPDGGREGVLIKSNQPAWVTAVVVHYFHPRPFVAVYSEDDGVYVIVETHKVGYLVGSVMSGPQKPDVVIWV